LKTLKFSSYDPKTLGEEVMMKIHQGCQPGYGNRVRRLHKTYSKTERQKGK